MPLDAYFLTYDGLRHHVGHKLEIIAVWNWQRNREESIEIRCLEKECAGSEPLFEMDDPHKAT